MQEVLYRWRVLIHEPSGDQRPVFGREEFGSLLHLWEELNLICFHPNDVNLFHRHTETDSRVSIFVRRKGGKSELRLDPNLNVTPYLKHDKVEVLNDLYVSRFDILEVGVSTRKYLRQYRPELLAGSCYA